MDKTCNIHPKENVTPSFCSTLRLAFLLRRVIIGSIVKPGPLFSSSSGMFTPPKYSVGSLGNGPQNRDCGLTLPPSPHAIPPPATGAAV